MNKLEKYLSYKESGVKWLGEIPEHWTSHPSKRFHRVLKVINNKRVWALLYLPWCSKDQEAGIS